MKEGFYSVEFVGHTGDSGFGMFVLDTGQVVGADVAGALYDGTYQHNAKTDTVDATINLTVPPGVSLVMGVPAQPKEWTLELNVSFPRETSKTPIRVQTQYGPVNAVIRFIRGFPA